MRNYHKPTDYEMYLFNQGTFHNCHSRFGAHAVKNGTDFTVWVPNAKSVRVAGSFNDWNRDEYFLEPMATGGVWYGFVPGAVEGDTYKYIIETDTGELLYKADPVAFSSQVRPETASVITKLAGYRWSDGQWLKNRAAADHFKKPLNIYEVHLGSWKKPDKDDPYSVYGYRQLADMLLPYVTHMGYTHVELMPITEHPFDGSWGYQATGYFAPSSRYGSPKDLKHLINKFHRAGIGVIMDWVPGHFCRDAHGLGRMNGHMLYENYDHQQWGTYRFDFGRPEVKSFLMSSAKYWLEQYHIDGFRVGGVSSMLYLNFGVENPSEKRYNKYGSEHDPEAIEFLRDFNRMVGEEFPGVFTVAEESSGWPLVTYPPEEGGLGFHYKWDMGWMNDTLKYCKVDFPHRRDTHNLLTSSTGYQFSDNYILPLSHDEVVHGKLSLIGRMPGDYSQKFAGLRLLNMYQMCRPGGKLNFMGSEFGQFIEWRYYESLEWFLLDYDSHRQVREFVRDMNRIYTAERSLWGDSYSSCGFKWLDADNSRQSVLSFIRSCDDDFTVILLNMCPNSYEKYRIGVPCMGTYKEIINSNAVKYGGSGLVNDGILTAEEIPMHGQPYSIELSLPPLSGTLIKPIELIESVTKS
ncbi:MAG: 1,4-alpha-glucan branching protein GlgB [Ruminococcaceae bacterium]|nr:1,4-alpha-glucan branching protein GlgB [Oscillospiraceae bacterium]